MAAMRSAAVRALGAQVVRPAVPAASRWQPLALRFASTESSVRLTPAVNRMIMELGLDPAKIKGTGPQLHLKGSLKQGPLILKSDVLRYLERGEEEGEPASPPAKAQSPQPAKSTAQQQPAGKAQEGGVSKSDFHFETPRRTSANIKFDVPHSYMSATAKMGGLLRMQAALHALDAAVTAEAVVLGCVAGALRDVPAIASVWSDNALRQLTDAHVHVTALSPAGQRTSVVPSMQTKGIAAIANEIADGGEATEEEYSSIGVVVALDPSLASYTNVLHPGHSCGLVVGPVRSVVAMLDSQVAVEKSAAVTMSFDPRAIREEDAARFLAKLAEYLQNPASML